MIIAFCGKAGAGKSTVAEAVQKKIGYARYSMASPIKQFFYHLFMWDTEHLYGHLKETDVRTPFVSMNDILIASRDTGIPIDEYRLLIEWNKVFEQFAVDTDVFDGYPATQYVISPRKAMQLFGTDVCRTIQEDIWIECARNALKRNSNNLIIDDARFDNEIAFVLENKGTLVHITGRGGSVGTAHQSEQLNVDKYNMLQFDNSGSKQKVVAFAEKLCNDLIVMADKDSQAEANL